MRKSILCLLILFSAHQGYAETDLTPSQATRQGQAIVSTSLNAQTIDLTLSDAIYLGLRDNRAIRSAYLDRIAQKFDLRVAEDRFTPKLSLTGSYLSNRNQSDRYRQGNLTPTSTLLTPYGTRFSLGWTYRHTQADSAGLSRNDGANITVIQPLLRGAGKAVSYTHLTLPTICSV